MPKDTQDLLLYALTGTLALIAAFGAYWARATDQRLLTLEADKLQNSGRLARLEAILENITKQLERIETELRDGRSKRD